MLFRIFPSWSTLVKLSLPIATPKGSTDSMEQESTVLLAQSSHQIAISAFCPERCSGVEKRTVSDFRTMKLDGALEPGLPTLTAAAP